MVFRKLHGIKPKKYHYMCIGRNTENDKFELYNLLLESSKEEVVLGVTVDNKLTFDSHITSICRKSGQKPGALLRITNYLIQVKKSLFLAE